MIIKEKDIELISFISKKCNYCKTLKEKYKKDKKIIFIDKDDFNKGYKKLDKLNKEKELRKHFNICPNFFHMESGSIFHTTPELARWYIKYYFYGGINKKNVGKIINKSMGIVDPIRFRTE